jgi:hypothetical protein
VTGPQSNPGERRRRTRNVVSYRGAGRRDSFGIYLVPRVNDIAGFSQRGDIAGFGQRGRCRFLAVIPANAGTQAAWVPAGAGMTGCNQRPPRNQRREAPGIFLARRDAPSRSRQCMQPDKARETADQRPSRTYEKRCRWRPYPYPNAAMGSRTMIAYRMPGLPHVCPSRVPGYASTQAQPVRADNVPGWQISWFDQHA